MANIKISQLPSATAVSANVDVLPIVHTGVTQKVTPDLLVNEVLKAPDYIGSDTPNDADFVDVVISGSLTASPVSKNINMSPTGSGRINMLPGGGMTVAPVGLGTMDNVVIGSTTAQSGAFTALTSSSATTLNGTTIPASKTLLVTTDIGSSVQAYDLDLAAIAGLTGTSGFLKKTGVNSWALDTVISSGTVTDVALTAPTGLTVSGSPITTSGTLAITYTSGYSLPTNASQANWDTAYADRLKWDGGATGLVAATGRTSLELGTLATQNANSVSITGGAISGASGSFTTLSASSTVSGTGFSNYLASPPAIGGSFPAAGAFTTLSSSSTTTVGTNLVFSGTGNRITGDFSNATVANRVMFQNSVANSATSISAIPSGTGNIAQFVSVGASDPTNASHIRMDLRGDLGEAQIVSARYGTGTFLPLTFYTGGSERVRISTAGVVTIGSAISLDPTTANALVVNSSGSVGIGTSSPATSFYKLTIAGDGGSGTGLIIRSDSNNGAATISRIGFTADGTDGKTGLIRYSHSDNSMQFWTANGTNNAERARITVAGDVLVTGGGGLGYGTGSGGTVTQGAGSGKATAVTLNKTTGQITMNNAALAAGAEVLFQLLNSTIGANDTVHVNSSFSTSGNYTAYVSGMGSGYAYIVLKNRSGGSLSEAVLINFAVIKGATS